MVVRTRRFSCGDGAPECARLHGPLGRQHAGRLRTRPTASRCHGHAARRRQLQALVRAPSGGRTRLALRLRPPRRHCVDPDDAHPRSHPPMVVRTRRFSCGDGAPECARLHGPLGRQHAGRLRTRPTASRCHGHAARRRQLPCQQHVRLARLLRLDERRAGIVACRCQSRLGGPMREKGNAALGVVAWAGRSTVLDCSHGGRRVTAGESCVASSAVKARDASLVNPGGRRVVAPGA